MNVLLKLSQSKNTVFSFDELQDIFGIENKQVFKNKLSSYVKKGILERISKGIYSLKDKKIDRFELANKIYSPSYISFFTALYHHGIIFQYENDVYLAYKKSDIKKIADFDIKLKCLKKDILLNPTGIVNNGTYSIAGAERAFLDTIYLYGDIYFDNLDKIDYEKVLELLDIYKKKSLEKKVKSYFDKY
ncbi:MAG: hypothetical protein PHH06_00735 [Candidatus Gracilibacteria bacterium]|nr:hypothetical protein [Candidatus Gracilibacteria bacterium]